MAEAMESGPDDPRSDPELLTAVRGGDRAAFGVLFRRHSTAAMRLARTMSRCDSTCDEIVSESFARVLDSICAGHGPDTAFRSYLLTTVRNTMFERSRRGKKIDLTDDDSLFDAPVPDRATPDAIAENSIVCQAFRALPERWRAVLWDSVVEGQSSTEIGQHLGMSATAVTSLVHRAREGLRREFLQAHVSLAQPDGCRETTEKLGAWSRNGLSKRERRAVDQHLNGCESCQSLATELAAMNTNLRAVLAPIVLGGAAAAYLASLPAAKSGLALGLGGKAVLAGIGKAGAISGAGALSTLSAAAVVALAVSITVVHGSTSGSANTGSDTTPVTVVATDGDLTPSDAADILPTFATPPIDRSSRRGSTTASVTQSATSTSTSETPTTGRATTSNGPSSQSSLSTPEAAQRDETIDVHSGSSSAPAQVPPAISAGRTHQITSPSPHTSLPTDHTSTSGASDTTSAASPAGPDFPAAPSESTTTLQSAPQAAPTTTQAAPTTDAMTGSASATSTAPSADPDPTPGSSSPGSSSSGSSSSSPASAPSSSTPTTTSTPTSSSSAPSSSTPPTTSNASAPAPTTTASPVSSTTTPVPTTSEPAAPSLDDLQFLLGWGNPTVGPNDAIVKVNLLKNTSATASPDVALVVDVPSGVSVLITVSNQVCTATTPGATSCEVGVLKPGEVVTITVTAIAQPGLDHEVPIVVSLTSV